MPTYTNISKPTGTGYTKIAKPSGGGGTLKVGMTMGLLIPLTNAKLRTIGTSYTKIGKPTGTVYTNVIKPIS